MAAARLLPLLRRRLAATNADSPAPSSRGFSFPPTTSAGLRSLLTVTEASNNASDNNPLDHEQECSRTDTPPASVPAPEPSFKVRDTSNLKISPRHYLAMIFTCKICETRSMKMASRDSYENGVVVARCGGCNSLHLIADRLGWFGEPGSIEDFLAAKGEEVKKGSTDTLNVSLDDLVGSQMNHRSGPVQSAAERGSARMSPRRLAHPGMEVRPVEARGEAVYHTVFYAPPATEKLALAARGRRGDS